MRGKLYFLSVAIGMSVLLTGCGEDIVGNFELTTAEEEQVVGYCADILLKYDKNHQAMIVDTTLARELAARVEAIKELNAQQKAAEEQGEDKNSSDKDKSKGADGGGLYAASGEQNLAAALGQEGFEVSYTGYEVCDSYPSGADAGDYFALEATAGKQLIVFHFDITNTTGDDRECDFLSSGVFYRIIVNGSQRKNALTTLLLNDMSTIDEVIPAGGSTDGVVVLETEKNYENVISSLTLLAKYGDGESVIPLQSGSVSVELDEEIEGENSSEENTLEEADETLSEENSDEEVDETLSDEETEDVIIYDEESLDEGV